ncbi:MAG: hypothetical protein U1F27_15250 [Turneriella sp.]
MSQHHHMIPLRMERHVRAALLLGAVFGFALPNGYFLYRYMKNPALMNDLLANPLGQAFLGETGLLLIMFMVAVWVIKKSWLRVFYYLLASFVGGLAFALPLFLWFNSVDKNPEVPR